MAIDFDALDLVRSNNKAKRHEAIKQQQREQKEKQIEKYMNEMNEISNKYYKAKNNNDHATKISLGNEWYNKLKLCSKKIEEK